MTTGRDNATASLLNDGRVLVAGGWNPATLSTAELYKPQTRSWNATASMATGRARHGAALLNDGRVLVAGGAWVGGEVWSPATGTWTTTGSMVNPSFTQRTATALADGRVLVAGGEFRECDEPQQENCWFVGVKSAELFTP
jgi:hypothetical protein